MAIAHNALVTYMGGIDFSQGIPPINVRMKQIRLSYRAQDTACLWASTPNGEAALNAQMDAARTTRAEGWAQVYEASAETISQGRWIRARAKEARDAVKARTLTGAQAKALSQYPTTDMVEDRKIAIEAERLFDNRFQTWRKDNPEGTYDDFGEIEEARLDRFTAWEQNHPEGTVDDFDAAEKRLGAAASSYLDLVESAGIKLDRSPA
ncbi:hypothetical protein [Tessaracoccus sp.]